MTELAYKTLIVSGASRGIGRALAVELAKEGVNLVLNARNPYPLSEVAAECQKLKVRVNHLAGNAAFASVAAEMVARALAIGSFYGFIHVAGAIHPGPYLWELKDEHFKEVFQANVGAAYQLIRAAVPEFKKQRKGLAVFFGSGLAESHLPGIGVYAMAKAAEEQLALQLAYELPEITCFVYRPGDVDTRTQEEARTAEGGAAEVLRRVFGGYKEQGDLLTAEESAKALVSILMNQPRRFHGKTASWTDGL